MENEEVKNTEEIVVDNPVEETNTEVVNENKEEKIEEVESVEFDPSSFADVIVAKQEDEEKEVISDNKEQEIDWITEEEKVVESETKITNDEPIENTKEVPVESNSNFKQVATDLGLDTEKFETIDDFKKHLQTLEHENNELRNSSGSNATNSSIKRLEELKAKEDTELVKLSLEKDGFEGDKLEDAVDRYIDNGLIEIEAQKIRKTIDNAIVGEQNKETQSTVDADAKQQQEHQDSVKKLEEHISKTDTMFGFKMSKDEDSLKNVQQGHVKYITSGSFMDDVFKNEESVAEVAWFTRNKDVIIKAIANKSLQKGKNAILDDIREPEVVSPQRFRDPDGSSEFDPSKFSA